MHRALVVAAGLGLLFTTACKPEDGTDPDPVVRDTDVAPRVNAGPVQVVEPGDEVTLEGTYVAASDPLWSQVGGPTVRLTADGEGSATFTAPEVTRDELLSFRFSAAGTGGIVADETAVIVRGMSVNGAPTAEAGDAQRVTEGATVTLSGTASDPEDLLASTRWTQVAGPTVSLAEATLLTTTFTAPDISAETLLVFTLTATDGGGATGQDIVAITVDPVLVAPLVEAGTNRTVDELTSVQLDATVSDPDGSIVRLTWTQVAGPTVTLSDATIEDPSFTAPDVGAAAVIALQLEAEDNDGVVTTDAVAIGIEPINLRPDVDAGADQVVDELDIVVLGATATDADGQITSSGFTQIAGPTVSFTGTTDTSATFVAPIVPIATALVFRFDATDNGGGTSTDFVQVTITPSNQPPVVNAGPDIIVDEGGRVVLRGTATDADGTIVESIWTQLVGPTVVLDTPDDPTATFTAPTVSQPEGLLFVLTVTDDLGATTVDFVTVSVLPLNEPPDIDAGSDQSVAAGDTVTLTGTAVDPDGVVATVGWIQTQGTAVILSAPDALTTTFVAPPVTQPELLIFRLDVVDGEGLVARDATRILVFPPALANQPPTVDAGLDLVVPSSTAVDLSGAAIDDDGSVVSQRWVQTQGPTVTLTDATTLSPSFTAPSTNCALHLVFELAATDDDGSTERDTVSVVVSGLIGDALGVPDLLSLDGDDGGLITDGATWEFGVPTMGPGTGWLGSTVWATGLATNYPDTADETLCVPPVVRGTLDDVTVSFRMWIDAGSNDGMMVEALDPDSGWQQVIDVLPTYDNSRGWEEQRERLTWILAVVPVPVWAGPQAHLRLRFRSNNSGTGPGAFIDEWRVDRESTDPDGDGLMGIADERTAWGTDPYLADSDGDGTDDGAEIAAGTDPLDPADFPGGPSLSPGDLLDFETSTGGLATTTDAWAWGTPSSGPAGATSGARVWATNLSGNYDANAVDHLYLPPIDLTSTTRATLSMRLWSRMASSDGASLEVQVDGTWGTLPVQYNGYTSTDAAGFPSWKDVGYLTRYRLVAASLDDYAGQRVLVRIALRTNAVTEDAGAYLDDLRISSESVDADSDGIDGVLDELLAWSTDPFVRDTDGDGRHDGAEASAGSQPLNPAIYPGSTTWSVGSFADLSSSPGGLATDGTLWAWGAPSSGPGVGATGARAWATSLTGQYFSGAREHLYLPAIDLAGTTTPVFGFSAWVDNGLGDGLSIEMDDPAVGWITLDPVGPPYDDTDPLGLDAWTELGGPPSRYGWAGFDLTPWIGQTVRLRVTFRSNTLSNDLGAYLDDFGVWENTDDPDGDGVGPMLTELTVYGTNPTVADTDRDGVDDGAEILAGTDPLDRNSF